MHKFDKCTNLCVNPLCHKCVTRSQTSAYEVDSPSEYQRGGGILKRAIRGNRAMTYKDVQTKEYLERLQSVLTDLYGLSEEANSEGVEHLYANTPPSVLISTTKLDGH